MLCNVSKFKLPALSIFPFPGILGSTVKHLVHQDPELHQGGGGGKDHQVWPTLAVPDRRDQEVILGTGPWQSLIIIKT